MKISGYSSRIPASVALLLVILLPLRADHHALDVAYAEHQPLAAESLLLDIIEVPGHGFLAVGERGHVVRSSDGRNWTQAEIVPMAVATIAR